MLKVMSHHKIHLVTILSSIFFSFLIISKWMRGYTLGSFPGTKNSGVVPRVGTRHEEGKEFDPL